MIKMLNLIAHHYYVQYVKIKIIIYEIYSILSHLARCTANNLHQRLTTMIKCVLLDFQRVAFAN